MWMAIEMDKIGYFKTLSLQTKQELIYRMERKTFEKGSLICKKGEKVDQMILIQDGIVEIAVQYDRRCGDQMFVIEKLGRGAIINHRSFMIRDEADTDFVCSTTVSAFVLKNDIIKSYNHRQDLKNARE